MNKINNIYVSILVTLLFTPTIFALSLEVIESPILAPGEEGKIKVELKNLFDDPVKEVSLNLDFKNLPFIPIGSSEQSIEEIEDDDEESFIFTIKASTDSVPGDYEIPFKINYILNNDDKTNEGTIGIKMVSQPELSFSISTEDPIVGAQGQLNLKIINKGLYDARFVLLKALPSGMTMLSDQDVYIGTIDSDDFETANFDVIFTKKNPRLDILIEYKDFNNNLITKTISLPVEVYSREQALNLGLIKKSKVSTYVIIAIVLIVIMIILRILKKKRRLRKSMKNQAE